MVTWPFLEATQTRGPVWTCRPVVFKNWNKSLRFCSEKNSTSHWSDFSPLKLHCSQGQKRRRQQEWMASHQFSLGGSCGRFWQNTNVWSGPVIIFWSYSTTAILLLLERCSIVCLSLSAASGFRLSCRCVFLITLQNMLSDSVTKRPGLVHLSSRVHKRSPFQWDIR